MAVSMTFCERLLLLLLPSIHSCLGVSSCFSPETIDSPLRDKVCMQPLFVTILPKTEEFQLLDNFCITFFPLPDDPNTFTYYQTLVYCDGSSSVETFIETESGKGTGIVANPIHTYVDSTVGYAGCDNYVAYRCTLFGEEQLSLIVGFSPKYNPIGLSCLRKVQEIIKERGLPDYDLYVLPMKLPSKCVTQQLCLQPPNPFYNVLPSVGKL